MTDRRIEWGSKTPFAEPTQSRIAISYNGKGDATFERIGDMPSSHQEVEGIVSSATLSNINDQERQILSRALQQLMQATQMGLIGFVEASNKSWAADQTANAANQLKQIALAFHNFNDAYRKFPASAATTREGSLGVDDLSELQPFSWRVAILPFIEEQKLFEKYRFDEPWDSEANSQLLSRMPELYRSPTAPADQPIGNANYQGFADGTGAIGIEDGYRMQDMLDGTSDTLLIMETESSVRWTEPQDLRDLPEFTDGAVLRYAIGRRIRANHGPDRH